MSEKLSMVAATIMLVLGLCGSVWAGDLDLPWSGTFEGKWHTQDATFKINGDSGTITLMGQTDNIDVVRYKSGDVKITRYVADDAGAGTQTITLKVRRSNGGVIWDGNQITGKGVDGISGSSAGYCYISK